MLLTLLHYNGSYVSILMNECMDKSMKEKEIGPKLTRQDRRLAHWSRRSPGLHCSTLLRRARVPA